MHLESQSISMASLENHEVGHVLRLFSSTKGHSRIPAPMTVRRDESRRAATGRAKCRVVVAEICIERRGNARSKGKQNNREGALRTVCHSHFGKD